MQMLVTAADIGMSTHAHFDHDAFERLDSGMILDHMAGTWEFGDIRVTGTPDKHECNPQGLWPWGHVVEPMTGINPCPPTDTTQWDNVMYVIETGGIRFLHWGDNRHNPPNEVWDQLTNIDVAFLAVDDSGHILNGEWALDIEKKLQPKIVFPAHYHIQGITVEASTLMPAGKWVKAHENHEILDSLTMTFNPDSIRERNRLRVPPWRERAAGKTDMEPLPVFGVTAARIGSDDEARRNATRWGGGAGRAFAAMDMNNSEPQV